MGLVDATAELDTLGLRVDIGVGERELVGFGVTLGFGDGVIETTGEGVALSSFEDLVAEGVAVGDSDEDEDGVGDGLGEPKFPKFTTLLIGVPETDIEIVDRPCKPSANK